MKRKSFREIANRITGFDIPIFGGGLSWNPPTLDIEVAQHLIIFLEDRRALYYPYSIENPEWVIKSVLEIRQRLTADLEQLDHASPLAASVRAMRAANREFLDKTENAKHIVERNVRGSRWDNDDVEFLIALGKLRAIIGFHIAQIAVRYGIDVEEDLASILPPSENMADTTPEPPKLIFRGKGYGFVGRGGEDVFVHFTEIRSAPKFTLSGLHQVLAEQFNMDELRTLCFDLGLDFDKLPGEGKISKARELIAHFQDRGQLLQLVRHIHKDRPGINLE